MLVFTACFASIALHAASITVLSFCVVVMCKLKRLVAGLRFLCCGFRDDACLSFPWRSVRGVQGLDMARGVACLLQHACYTLVFERRTASRSHGYGLSAPSLSTLASCAQRFRDQVPKSEHKVSIALESKDPRPGFIWYRLTEIGKFELNMPHLGSGRSLGSYGKAAVCQTCAHGLMFAMA